MVESGVDACASDTRALGGDCVGRFSKVLKCSCHLAATVLVWLPESWKKEDMFISFYIIHERDTQTDRKWYQ